jgi:hypothetical protein
VRRPSALLLLAALACLSCVPAAGAATKKAKAPAPLTATAAFPDGSTQTWSLRLDGALGTSGVDYRTVSRPDAATIVYDEYYLPGSQSALRTAKAGKRKKKAKPIRCTRVTMHVALAPSDGTGEPITIARTLLPHALLEQAFSTRPGGDPLHDDATDVRVALRADGDPKADSPTDSVAVSDWSAGTLRGWKQLTVHAAAPPRANAKRCRPSFSTTAAMFLISDELGR